MIDRSKIMEFYDHYIDTEDDIDFLVSELRSIYKKEHPPAKFHILNKEFDVKSDSWQVEEANANGHYEFVKYEDWCENEDMYIFKHTETGRLFAVDEEALKYLIIYKDYQDYRFIYVGWWGEYRTLGI